MSDDELIDEISHYEQEIDRAFAVPFKERAAEANRRFAAGEKPCYSTGIDDSITCGYGYIDQFGFWQYPLVMKEPDHART